MHTRTHWVIINWVSTADETINALIAAQAQEIQSDQYGYIERRLLEGCDRLIIEEITGTPIWREIPAGETSSNPTGRLSRTVYEIPRWRDQPVTRFRIWRARRRYQRTLA